MKLIKNGLKSESTLVDILRVAPNLAYNFFSLFFNKKSFSGPIFLSWNLTSYCQLKCRHCLIDSKSSFSSKKSLSVARNIAKSSVYWVAISGGEPFVAPGIVDIIRILKNKRKKVTVVTNGAVLEGFVDDLITLGLDVLYISMDSHRKEVHDYLRNCPGLFDKVLKTIAEIKAKRRSKKPLIRLRCTLSKANYLEMVEYVDFWRDKVDSIHFQPIMDNISRVREKSLMFDEENKELFCNILSKLQEKYRIFRSSYYTLMPDYIFNRQKLYEKLKYKCLLMSSSGLCLLSDGSAALCYGRKNFILGNAVDKSIIEIWKTSQIKEERERILSMPVKTFCSDCFCWCPSAYFNIYLLRFYNFLKKFLGKKHSPKEVK